MMAALDMPGRLKLAHTEPVDKGLQRHAVLQRNGNGDGELIHHTAHRGRLSGHIDKNLTQPAVGIFARAQKQGMVAHCRFLRKAVATGGQRLARGGSGCLRQRQMIDSGHRNTGLAHRPAHPLGHGVPGGRLRCVRQLCLRSLRGSLCGRRRRVV